MKKVSAVVEEGTTTTRTDIETSSGYEHGWSHTKTALAEELDYDDTQISGFFGGIFANSHVHALMDASMERWKKLYFCFRCNHVYNPETKEYASPSDSRSLYIVRSL